MFSTAIAANELTVLSKISALDQFMLDDSRDWFYFSEILIDNAYRSIERSLDLLLLDHEIKDSLKSMRSPYNSLFTNLSILVVLFPLLVRSEANMTLVQSCLSHLENNHLLENDVISMSSMKLNTLDDELEIYKILPHMKALVELITAIQVDLKKS